MEIIETDKEKEFIEQKLNTKREINGTVYNIKAFFNKNGNETVFSTIHRLIKKS